MSRRTDNAARDADAVEWEMLNKVESILDRRDDEMLAVWNRRRQTGMKETHRRLIDISARAFEALRRLGYRRAFETTYYPAATPPAHAWG